MQDSYLIPIVIMLAILFVAALSFYAGSLLLKLNKQNAIRQDKIQARIVRITESIQTISMAMEQQQCNLSEGCIRLYHLLSSVPINNPPNYAQLYPAVHELYHRVENLPTHQARKELKPAERRRQDAQREEEEVQLESKILLEVAKLKNFSV